jgi:hypothetical protein
MRVHRPVHIILPYASMSNWAWEYTGLYILSFHVYETVSKTCRTFHLTEIRVPETSSQTSSAASADVYLWNVLGNRNCYWKGKERKYVCMYICMYACLHTSVNCTAGGGRHEEYESIRKLACERSTLAIWYTATVDRIYTLSIWRNGARGSVVVKALCYKPEGRGFDSRWGEFLNLPNPSGRTRPWGLLNL